MGDGRRVLHITIAGASRTSAALPSAWHCPQVERRRVAARDVPTARAMYVPASGVRRPDLQSVRTPAAA
jgi:hypothetical protein